MSLRARLARLERRCPRPGSACPHCPPGRIVTYWQEDPDSEPVLGEGQVVPPPCAHCGRPADVLEIVHIVVGSPEDVARWERAQSDG
jgi:hypothetical protein